MGRMVAIETDGLSKRYGDVRGIEDVTFAVESGEVFGLLGPNGAGKTTAIRTLLDLLHPTRGSARIFGLDSHRDSVAIRARLGNLPGDFGYGKQASGREVLILLARLRGIDGLGRAETLAERFRADLDRPLGQLSRGNRQKIGLILACFHSPELLILDERPPTRPARLEPADRTDVGPSSSPSSPRSKTRLASRSATIRPS
jgi:ABC-2 type transport system ATP-binding protein